MIKEACELLKLEKICGQVLDTIVPNVTAMKNWGKYVQNYVIIACIEVLSQGHVDAPMEMIAIIFDVHVNYFSIIRLKTTSKL